MAWLVVLWWRYVLISVYRLGHICGQVITMVNTVGFYYGGDSLTVAAWGAKGVLVGKMTFLVALELMRRRRNF